jgi:hypothetical protein
MINSMHKQVPSMDEQGPDGLDMSIVTLLLSRHVPSVKEDAEQCSKSCVPKFESIISMQLRIALSIHSTLLPPHKNNILVTLFAVSQ